MTERKPHKGLSPSSLATFTSCQRKYFYSKVMLLPKDRDADNDMENLHIGSAFHECLEETKHELKGFEYPRLLQILETHSLDSSFGPMLYAMLLSYKSLHEKAGLKAIGCELEVETDDFYGFVDVVLSDSEGNWWIGDNKTAGSYTPNIIPTLFSHPQINLYALHAPFVAGALQLPLEKFMGCRYRLTTKSKLIQKDGETDPQFIERLRKVIRSYDFILPKERLNTAEIAAVHSQAFRHIEENRGKMDPANFTQNFGNCFAYYKPCSHFSQCHKKIYSDLTEVECVVSE